MYIKHTYRFILAHAEVLSYFIGRYEHKTKSYRSHNFYLRYTAG